MPLRYKENIGTIKLGEIAYLSDPAFSTSDNWNCTMLMVPGDYMVFITRTQSKMFNGTISNIYAINKEYYKYNKKRPQNDNEMLYCGAVSGYCGIFDADYFEQYHDNTGVDDDWFEDKIDGINEYAITDERGAVCFDGISMGKYKVYAEYANGKAFAVRINFF